MGTCKEYLVFREGLHHFGISLSEVEKVEKAAYLEAVPQMPDFVKGLLNYHGQLLPVIDVASIFMLDKREEELSDYIIIARTSSRMLGFWAEDVVGVVSKSEEEVEEAQRFYLDLDYVKGVFVYADHSVMINDIEKFLEIRELKKLAQLLEQNPWLLQR